MIGTRQSISPRANSHASTRLGQTTVCILIELGHASKSNGSSPQDDEEELEELLETPAKAAAIDPSSALPFPFAGASPFLSLLSFLSLDPFLSFCSFFFTFFSFFFLFFSSFFLFFSCFFSDFAAFFCSFFSYLSLFPSLPPMALRSM